MSSAGKSPSGSDPAKVEVVFEEEEEKDPVELAIKLVANDRWKDEDQDEDVKDNWDDEDEEEEEKKDEANKAPPKPVAKKKLLKDKLKEKEERRIKAESEEKKIRTPEEILADKLEAQRLQEESDLMLAKETFGVAGSTNYLSGAELVTKDDFDNFRKSLTTKLQISEKSPHYVNFLEACFRDICVSLDVDDIKKLSSSLNALYNEKIKAQKSNKPKKKAVVKSAIKLERNALQPEYDDDFTNEYEEFL